MQAEPQLFDDQDRADFSEAEKPALYDALQAVLSPDADQRLDGLARINKLKAHLKSPLVAAALAHRLHEPDIKILANLVDLLAVVIRNSNINDHFPASRRWAMHALRQMGMREIDNLLELASSNASYLENVALILNECSLAGEMLVSVFTDGMRDLEHRLLAVDLIDRVGFMEAVPMIELWITRLTNRQERQMRMSFAPAPDSETDSLLPALQTALISLERGQHT